MGGGTRKVIFIIVFINRNSSATLDRINMIKATLIHPDYPVNPVKN